MLSNIVGRLPTPLRRQIERRINLLRVAENTGWLIANKVMQLVIAMVVGIWVARYLGVAQYGMFSYAVSLNALLRTVIALGLNSLIVRDLARSREMRNMILGSAFYVQVALSFVMVAVALGISVFFQQDDPIAQSLTRILAIGLIAVPFEVLGPWWQSQLQSVKALIANTTSLLVMAIGRIALIYFGASIEAFVYLLLVERVVNLLTQYFIYHRDGESIRRWHLDLAYAWQVVKEGMPLFWTMVAREAYTRGNFIMLRALATPADVGYYAAANRVAQLYLLVPTAIVSSSMPIVSQAKMQDQRRYHRQVVSLVRVTFLLGVGTALAVGLLAQWLMPMLFGAEFAGASAVLVISAWTAIPQAFNLITSTWVINEGLASVMPQKVLVLAGLVVALNLYLIPLYGAPGAALSYLIAAVLVHIVWDFVDPRMRPLGMLKLHAVVPWWPSHNATQL